MNSPRKNLALAFLSMILSAAIVAIVHIPDLMAWEKANGYPFGQICNSLFTGYVDTCPAKMR